MLATASQAGGAVGSLRARPTATLSQLGDVLTKLAASHHDQSVSSRSLRIDEDTGQLQIDGSGQSLTMRQTALSQLASKLRVPASYLRRCPPDLLARNVNHWLRDMPARELMLRCDGDEARAVVSPRYQPVDNVRLVEMLADNFGDDTPLRYELTESQLVIQFVNRREPEVAGRGDLLHVGINVRNSEVGLSSIEIGGLVYRTICLNGLILSGRGVSWRRKHIGNTDLGGEVREAITSAQQHSQNATSTFASTSNIVVPKPTEAIDRVVKHYQLSEAQSDAIHWGYRIEPGDRLYHVINSVTRGANHESLSLGARRHLQEVGGRMLIASESGRSWL